mgnify:CR=1 FL=1
MKITRKDLYKKGYNSLSMFMLTLLACFGVWSFFSDKLILKILGIALLILCLKEMTDFTKYRNAIDKGEYAIYKGMFNLYENGTLSIKGKLFDVRHFAGLNKLTNGEEIYLITVKNSPITIYRVKLVELDDELKNKVIEL